MEVTHFEIRKAHQFELIFHCVGKHGREHEMLEGRDVTLWRLVDKCRLNGDFRHLQMNAKP